MPVTPTPSFRDALGVWLRIAMQSFGGPAGQIAVVHRIVVEEKKWISATHFFHALNYCMLLPGPEAQQLVTYIGWLLHGWRGGLTAGLLFIFPGAAAILALSIIYAAIGHGFLAQAVFLGLKSAVIAIIVEALIQMGRKTLHDGFTVFIAAAAFVSLFLLNIPFPIILTVSAVLGFCMGKIKTPRHLGNMNLGAKGPNAPPFAAAPKRTEKFSLGYLVNVLWIGFLLWWVPVAVVLILFGAESIFFKQCLFFSKTAVLTFGGAYSVLAYVAQQAVSVFGWLSPDQMMDGLSMAETTPGPLIMVLQFVGFISAFQNPEGMDPFLAGMLGSAITTWVTFVPCFIWVFAGAPYMETLRNNYRINYALSAVTAAVTGVILNLAVWFTLHTLFSRIHAILCGPFHIGLPDLESLNPLALVIALAACWMMFIRKMNMFWTLGVCFSMGLIFYWFKQGLPA